MSIQTTPMYVYAGLRVCIYAYLCVHTHTHTHPTHTHTPARTRTYTYFFIKIYVVGRMTQRAHKQQRTQVIQTTYTGNTHNVHIYLQVSLLIYIINII